MTAAATRAAAVRPAPLASPAQAELPDADAWPTGLKLVLFVLVTFAINVAAVLYLAGQMPT